MKRFNSNVNVIEKIIRILTAGIILGVCINSCNLGNTLKYSDDNEMARLLFSKSSIGRLIGPTDIDEDDVVKAELYACPANSTREKKLKTWESISLMEAENELLINPGTYDFTLKLYVSVGGVTVLSQTGTINLTVNPGDNLLSFNTQYVSEGIGNLSVGVQWTETTKIEKVLAKLYKLNSNLSTDFSNKLYEQFVYNDSETEIKRVAQFDVSSIDSGYYSLVLEIYDNSEMLLNTFEYTAKIVSGCTSHASLTLEGINALYSLTYIVNQNAVWNDSHEGIFENSSTLITLPSAVDISLRGYELQNWNTELNGSGTGYTPGSNLTISKDTTLYAQWRKLSVVTFVNDTTKTEVTVYSGSTVTEPSEPTKDGYSFVGWFMGDVKYDFNSPVINDIVLITKWIRGEGTESSPYLIGSVAEWNEFAESVNAGVTFEGKTVKLSSDVGSAETPCSLMVGSSIDNSFKGTFDGNGKTLTVVYNVSEAYCAPFRYVDGATIKNLNISGSITTSKEYAAGLISYSQGDVIITDCVNSVELMTSFNGNAYVGGFVSNCDSGSITISNCVFLGKLLVIGNSISFANGGFVSVNNASAVMTDCLFSPSELTQIMGASTSPVYIFAGGQTNNLTYCYYTKEYGRKQGTLVYISPDDILDGLYESKTIKNNTFYIVKNISISNYSEKINYSGNTISISPVIKTGNTTLTEGTDYTKRILNEAGVEVASVKDVGAYSLIINGIGSYAGTIKKQFFVISAETLSVNPDSSAEPGSEENPYLIYSIADFYKFAKNLSVYNGKYIKLMADIGSAENPVTITVPSFSSGTFDGNNKTITLKYNAAEYQFGLFKTVHDVTIKNLKITGEIKTANSSVASFIGKSTGDTRIINCLSDVSIIVSLNGQAHCSGFVAHNEGELIISDCAFTGGFYSTNGAYLMNGFVFSYNPYTAYLNNCLFAPKEIAMTDNSSSTFFSSNNNSINSCYYTRLFGKKQGEKVYLNTSEIHNTFYDVLNFFGTNYYVEKNINIDNIFERYTYDNGNPISLSYTVSDKNEILNEGIDYNAIIINELGETVISVTEPGNYSLILTGMGNYSGVINKSFSVTNGLSGNPQSLDTVGSMTNPYLINNIADWQTFVSCVNNGYSYSNEYIKLTTDIGTVSSPITTMIGNSSKNSFQGSFDGNGKTLTVYFDVTELYCAPFRYIKNASIENLTIQGTIISSAQYAAGFVASSSGKSYINNCVCQINLSSSCSGSGLSAGFVAYCSGTLSINKCIFVGKLNRLFSQYNTSYAGFVAGAAGDVLISNSLFAPIELSFDPRESFTFVRGGSLHIGSSYYVEPFGTVQGYPLYSFLPTNENSLFTYETLIDGNSYYLNKGTIINNLSNVYDYNTNSILVDYNVTTDTGIPLEKDIDYTAVIRKANGEIVDTVTEIGQYSLAITGIGNYYGTQTQTFAVMDALKGDGTVGNPYLIEDIVDWNLFAGRINNGDSFEGMNVKLAENIGSVTSPVTTMAGKDATYCFKGIFDGNGKTMTVAYNTTESVCALFRYVNKATIKNLTVEGEINTSSDYASGLVGNSIGSVTISNCVSKIEINSSYNGNSYDAGFVGLNTNSVSIQDCTFAGKLLGADTLASNGFVGKNSSRVTVKNCLFIPSEITMDDSDSWTFVKDGTKTINNSYYIQSFGTEQGIQATLQPQDANIVLKTFEGGYQCYVPE